MTVLNCTGKTRKEFKHQSFFSNFNWGNFERGDIVWLEDYDTPVMIIAGVFVGFTEGGDPLVRLMTNRHSLIFANHSLQNILDSNSAAYWEQKYLS